MKTYLRYAAGALPALALTLASCSADKIEVPDKELYTREFIKQFGTFRSDQGWNSASRVTADIDPSAIAGATEIKVYTAWPTTPGCRIAASFPATVTTFSFDFPASLELAYVKATDADGKTVYGAYAPINDGRMHIGTTARGSRANEPTGGSHYQIYTYDLTSNGALGTFLTDEDYNRDFWKKLGLWTPIENVKDDFTPPDGIDTETVHELWSGTHESGDWGAAYALSGSTEKFNSNPTNHFKVTVSGILTDPSTDGTFILQYQTDPNDEWYGFGEMSTGNCVIEKGNEQFSASLELHQDDVAKLREYPLAIKGTNITFNTVQLQGLTYEQPGMIGNPDANIDPDKIHTAWSDDDGWDLGRWGNNLSLSGMFGNVNSNNIELTISAQVINPGEGQHMFSVQRGDNSDIFGSGNIVINEGAFSLTTHINESRLRDLMQPGTKIAGNNVKIKSISYKENPYRHKTTGGKANLSDVFRLYGLTTSPGVSDMDSYRTHALSPYNDYDMTGYSAHDLISLVGSKSGVFHEEVDKSTNQCNLMRFKDQLRPDAGVDYELKEAGEVSLDYFFGCASTFNSFGYFYYTDEEASLHDSDPDKFAETILRKPKFILIYRAFPHSNILIQQEAGGTWRPLTDLATIGYDNIVQSGDDEGKDKSDNWQHCGEFTRMVDQAESEVENGQAPADRNNQYPRFRSANYRLVYFRPDQFEADGVTLRPGQQGNYIFPAGTHVAFFVINGGQYALQKDGSAGFQIDHTRISFSRPLLNKYLGNVFNAHGHSHSSATSPSTNIPGPNAQDPWTPFVTYAWGGDIIMGVEDYFARTNDGVNGSDHDMNDMLFRVKGNFVNDREELNPNKPVGQNWIIACEDLGGTYDFDFNDVVFGVTHIAGESKATITALASGGTLHVYLESRFRQATNSSSKVETVDGITYYTLTPEDTNDGEFHSWWGSDRPHSTIINASGWNGPGKSIEIEVDENFTLSDMSTVPGAPGANDANMGGFRVRVYRNGQDYNVISAPTQDASEAGYEAPQMFLVPHTWKWPRERQFIRDVYTGFNDWQSEWWKLPDGPAGSNIIRHNWVPGTITGK